MTGELPRIGIRIAQEIAPRRAIELARAAETNGFVSLWFAENPFHRGILPVVSACAAATERTTLGIGIVNPYQHHPTQIAADYAALDELAGGRVKLGIGSGVGPRIERLGRGYQPLPALIETLAILRPLLRGETVTYRGRLFSADGVALHFRPPRPDMPLYLASMGDRSLALSGRLGDGVIISNMCPPGYSERAAGIVQAAAAAAGRPPLDIVQYVPCAARPDRAEAHRIAKYAIGAMLMAFWPTGEVWPALRETIVTHSGIARPEFVAALGRLRCGEDATVVLDNRFVDAFAIAGTAEECLAQAARYRFAGVDELALSFAGEQPEIDMAFLATALRSQ